jgi:hypothetical protein
VVKLRRVTWLVLSALLAAAPAPAQKTTLEARARVDSTRYRVGDWVHVTVELRHPHGTTFRHGTGDSLGGFLVLERLPLVAQNDTTTATGYVVAKYDSGTATLPPVSFFAIVPGDSTRILQSNPLVLDVRTVAVDTTKDFRDLKPPLSISLTTAEILAGTAILLLLVTGAYAGYRYWRKRRANRGRAGASPPVPERPAHVIALEQLAALKEKKLWQRGQVKEFYSEITEIFRRYLENRYAMTAMEETSDEILAGMRQRRFPAPMLDEAERILRRADLVKFAKYQPVASENEEMFTVVGDIVEKTRIVQMTSAAPSTQKVEAHAGS